MISQEEYLNGIVRTRLLCNTASELYIQLGYSEDTKSFGKVGGKNTFIKQAILFKLDDMFAKKISPELDLVEVLSDYIKASDLVKDLRRHGYFKNNIDSYAALIEWDCCMYSDASKSLSKKIIKALNDEAVDNSVYALPIMLLILWDILPPFFYKKEAADVSDIKGEFNKMLDSLEKAISCSPNLKNYLIIDRLRNQIKHGSEELNRLHLIYSLTLMLGVIYSNQTFEDRLDAVRSMEPLNLPLEGYWEDEKAEDAMETKWHFEAINDNTYIVRQLLRDRNDAFYRRYEMNMFSDEGEMIATFADWEVMNVLIKTGQVPTDMQIGCRVDFDNYDRPAKMMLECFSGKDYFTTRVMRRMYDQNKGKEIFSGVSSLTRSTDYEIVANAFAITSEYIYFRDPERDGFYKVPKTDGLQDLGLEELLMMKSPEGLAVGSGATLCYLDISNESKMEACGVTRVKHVDE